MFFSRPAGHRICDRGDITSHDFELAAFTIDSQWHILSLAAIVPSGAKFVLLYFTGFEDAGGKVIRLRKTGYTGSFQFPTAITPAANMSTSICFLIPCNTAREIDYKIQTGNWAAIELNVLGWVK